MHMGHANGHANGGTHSHFHLPHFHLPHFNKRNSFRLSSASRDDANDEPEPNNERMTIVERWFGGNGARRSPRSAGQGSVKGMTNLFSGKQGSDHTPRHRSKEFEC